MAKKFLILIVLSVLIVISCGPEWSGNGIILEKQYDDPDDWYVPGHTIQGTETCSGGYNGIPRTCTRSPDIYVAGYWMHEPERFLFKLQDTEPNKDGKYNKFTVQVPELLWSSCQVNEQYSRSEGWCGQPRGEQ